MSNVEHLEAEVKRLREYLLEVKAAAARCELENESLRAEAAARKGNPLNCKDKRDALRLDKARWEASHSVLVQALASMAKRHPDWQQWAQNRLKAADDAFMAVKAEDLVRAHV